MQTKLTLRMDDSVVDKAKRVARRQGKSVSRMLSDYVAALPDDLGGQKLPPVTASMVGVLPAGTLPDAVEKEYGAHLERKHL
jgi:hypothetical protein